MNNPVAVDPSRRFESLAGDYTAKHILNYLGKNDAIALRATGPTGPISEEVEKHEYQTHLHIYHNSTIMSKDEILKSLMAGDEEIRNSRLRFTGFKDFSETGGEFDLDQILQIFVERGNSPFNKNFDKNFPFLLTLNGKRYVLSLNPLKTINNSDGTSVVLEYVKTLLIEPLYEYKDGVLELKSLKFINFLDEDPSSVSHFKKKKASSKKKKASQKKKASPKAKKASQKKKKKASPKKKNHGGLS